MTLRSITCALLLAGVCEASAATRALIVSGLGGNEKYTEEFERDVQSLYGRLQVVTDDVVLLVNGGREAVAEALAEIGKRSSSADALVFVYVGHGTFDGEAFRFNVAGRDFTGGQLDEWLSAIETKHQLVVVTGSSSGALLGVLENENRTLITGTRSGEQKNATVFARYFVGALTSDAADINKDQRVSAQEAFDYAKSRVEGYYEELGQMATEHPQSEGPSPAIVLAQIGDEAIAPRLAGLVEERESLELAIEQLKARKDEYGTEEYFGQLQKLLLELALIEQQIDDGQEADDS
jgi:hypothetical protein